MTQTLRVNSIILGFKNEKFSMYYFSCEHEHIKETFKFPLVVLGKFPLRKFLHGKFPPIKLPSGKFTPGKFPPREFPPGIFAPISLINCLSSLNNSSKKFHKEVWYLQSSLEFSQETLTKLIKLWYKTFFQPIFYILSLKYKVSAHDQTEISEYHS